MRNLHFLVLFIVIFLGLYTDGFCQETDTTRLVNLQTIIISSYKYMPIRETSLNISSLNLDSLTRIGNYNLTDLMAKTPGVSMLSTGIAIAKPVIRGLYGNRILILLSGMKFDNQQWQEEHGLGLSDLGLSRVEIIKGPLGVLYGTEAIGGIINVIEEEKPAINTNESDFAIRLNSNTRGGLIQGAYKENNGKNFWRIRVGYENNADYSDGNGDRVLNSRFNGYYLKGTYGFQKKKWLSTFNFMSSYNQYGFIFNDVYTIITPDERWSRDLTTNPAHMVILNILSSENKIILKDESQLDLNVGFQSNQRMEREGGGSISLNMNLFTLQYLLKWNKQLSEKNKLIVSNLFSIEDNTNLGARKIVPDANMQEANISTYLETKIKKNLILENGIGAGEKWIQTYFTADVNGPEQEVKPFSKLSPYYNFFTGVTYFPNEKLNVKFNIASGVRIPNLAELSSNGLHEGVFTYEIGNPDLKNEQNYTFNLYFNYDRKYYSFSVSPFYTLFTNYVYLAPTTEEWYGFPVYRYKQQNTTQFGSEVELTIKPLPMFNFGVTYSGMQSKAENGEYTPYIPGQKVVPNANYTFKVNTLTELNVFANVEYYFPQNDVAPNELATPAYNLLNAGIATSFTSKAAHYVISLAGNNLLNTAYYDHLSRFKYYGILNIGRNFVLNFSVKF